MVVRASALLALAGDLAVYYAVADDLEPLSVWGDVVVVGLALIPATFGLVWLALPARRSPWLLPATLVFGGLAAAFEILDLEIAASFLKLAAVTGAGWFFLRFFEEVGWIVLVALLIIPIDIVSVARGPTRTLIQDEHEVFDYLSVSFPTPSGDGLAQLGLPDVLFFALFLGAADRFGLRVFPTWLACTLSFPTTLAISTAFDFEGVPALPLLSAAFVAVNADLLLRRIFRDGRDGVSPRGA
jgi:hypothetical protein